MAMVANQTSRPKFSILTDPATRKALLLLALAATYSPLSHLTLTPVYGSVPSSLFYRYGLLITALVAILGKELFRRYLPRSVSRLIPAFCVWIPTIQFILFKYSSVYGNPYGPLITELLTFYPLALLSIHTALSCIDQVDLSSHNEFIAQHGPTMGSYLFLITVQSGAKNLLTRNIGLNILMTRLGLQISIAALYVLAIPDALKWPALPSLAFTMLGNVHNPLMRTTAALNNELARYNFTLLERRESITGYISVLENTQAQFRVMRCDHSLLGGEWTMPRRSGHDPPVREPIYAIFAMLEAVRLVETDDMKPRIPDSRSTALNIGLGVGTAPSALMAHGVNTTIIELDPVVYSFAMKYFGLPMNHNVVIGDAVGIIENNVAAHQSAVYDYIIHDVFTGGAEPVELFTFEFLNGLKQLLKSDGVIAIVSARPLPCSSWSSDFSRTTRVISLFQLHRSLSVPSLQSFQLVASSARMLHLEIAWLWTSQTW